MKILIVRPFPDKKNLSSYNLQEIGLAKALVRKGHVCDVVYYNGTEQTHVDTITFDGDSSLKVIWLQGIGIAREGIYPSLAHYAKDYDILQVCEYTGVTACYLAVRFPKKVVYYHGPYYSPRNHGDRLKALVFDRALLPLQRKKKMIVATKSHLATEYLQQKGIPHVTTVGVGLDLTNLEQDVDTNEFTDWLVQEKGEDKYLLYIGRLEPRRNTLFLLDVFKRVLNRYPNCKLILIGQGEESYKAACFKKIKKLGLNDHIIYREELDQQFVRTVYQLSDVFLLPSRYEIFGMVLLEAMYYGLPVVTTYNGGSATMMNKDNGVVLNGFWEDEWAGQTLALLNDEAYASFLGSNAHDTIADNYTWDAMAGRFIELYEQKLKS